MRPPDSAFGSPTPRVVFDHRIFISQVHGGISRYFANIAAALPAFGVTPRVIAPLHINAYLGGLPRDVVFGRRVPPTHNRHVQQAIRRLDTALLPPLARRFGADIVHETYYWPRRLAPARTKVALSVFDMIHELFPEQWVNDPTSAFKQRAVRDADLIFCISESTRRDLIALYPDAADRTLVTLLGFDIPVVSAAEAPTDSVADVGTRPFILYVGARAGYKNFATLLEAYAQSPRLRGDCDLVCVGGGKFSEGEARAIEKTKLTGHVRQVSADDRTLREYYRSATLFVYPSRYEGFGLPPLEAMAEQCPVAASNTSSIPEVCGDAAEYFDPSSAASMTKAMERALYETGRMDALRKLGVERLTHFSWERCAQQTAAGYRSMVK